ncbi:hypothetical protein [Enterobacter bugandensis]|uniref:hypothetical protein n=1 Tax=Enterobacter bugandensis TaxID=881260 RepID=UPI000AF11999|nr:hypothetical protein [Enterobacter bugandensis]
MSWPVQIIPPCEKISEIKWSRWLLSLLCILLAMAVCWFGGRAISPVEGGEFLKLSALVFLWGMFVFFFIISVRMYFYGLCLSVIEAREHEAELTKKNWTEWANRKFYVSAYSVFLPSVVTQADIAFLHSTEIYKDQKLKLRGHNGTIYTEEQLIYELLSSVRARLLGLKELCIFDVIFTYSNSLITFSTFKECWASTGFNDDCLGGFYGWSKPVEQQFDILSDIAMNRVSIIISVNMEGVEGYCPESSEFASIFIVTHQQQIPLLKENNSVALRTMACNKNYAKQDFLNMATYQPDVLKTTKVVFGDMSSKDALHVSEIFRSSSLSMSAEWNYEVKHLNLMLGKLDDAHLWLVFVLSLIISEKNNEPVLMVTSVGDDYVFNVIKPFDNNKGR